MHSAVQPQADRALWIGRGGGEGGGKGGGIRKAGGQSGWILNTLGQSTGWDFSQDWIDFFREEDFVNCKRSRQFFPFPSCTFLQHDGKAPAELCFRTAS